MKHLLLLLFIACSGFSHVQAQKDTSGLAKIYLIRYTGRIGSALAFKLYMNDIEHCRWLWNKSYTELWAKPGLNSFSVIPAGDKKDKDSIRLQIPMEAGKTYYLFMVLKEKKYQYKTFVEEITYRSASPFIAELKKDETCNRDAWYSK